MEMEKLLKILGISALPVRTQTLCLMSLVALKYTHTHNCPSVLIGDWFQNPLGYQNLQMLVSYKNGIVFASYAHLPTYFI